MKTKKDELTLPIMILEELLNRERIPIKRSKARKAAAKLALSLTQLQYAKD